MTDDEPTQPRPRPTDVDPDGTTVPIALPPPAQPPPAQTLPPAPPTPPEPEPAPAPEPASARVEAVAAEPEPEPAQPAAPAKPVRRRLTGAGAMIAVLIALLGFTLVVQLRSNTTDPTLATQRQEDLVRILSDLEAKDKRLRDDISRLENSQRELNSGAQGREAALAAATERADELGILAGTLAARGEGLRLRFEAVRKPVRAESLLDAVQELRGAQAEAMQVQGADGTAVRVIASTSFLDRDDDVVVDGVRLSAPYTITVIGDPETMRTALNIPGGVVESVASAGGTVIFSPAAPVEVTALHDKPSLQYAKPVS